MFVKTNLKTNWPFSLLLVLLFTYSNCTIAQTQIWGASNTGSENGIGDIFTIYDDGSEYTVKNSFLNDNDGNAPKTKLTEGDDGWYYGTTTTGGDFNGGSIFRIHEQIGFEALYHFNPSVDGSNSKANLLKYDDQTFVGATSTGGPDGGGVIFKYHLTGGFENLFNLDQNTTGTNITGNLLLEDDDNIYVTCSNGGVNGFGTILSFDLEDNLVVKHSFSGQENGSYPQGGMVNLDDWYYGTTQFGGNNSQGTIFRYSIFEDVFEIAHHIAAGGSQGRYPFGTLLLTSDDVLMGTCSEGGTNATGTIFGFSPENVYTTLHSFQASTDGGFPKAGLTELDDNLFYGVTEFGGSNGFGTIYSVDNLGNFTKVVDLDYSEDGSSPSAALLAIDSETLLGVAASGGANNNGTIFKYGEDSGIENIHSFSIPRSGANPQSTQIHENQIYGTTYSGGVYNGGVLYKTSLDGTTEILHEFHPLMDGQNPNGDIHIKPNGSLFGTTRFGGVNQFGSVFTVTSDGNFAAMHYFTGGVDGQFPYAGITAHSNGKMYGTTLAGGLYGHGTIYSIDQTGEFENETSFFNFLGGGSPESTLIEASNGKLYGVNSIGGNYNNGALYEFDPETNTATAIHQFQSATDGKNPKGNLMIHSNGAIYGTTSSGASGAGSIWKYDFTTGFELVHAFNASTEGSNANGGLIEDENGTVYGFCSNGGLFNSGTCFSYNETNGLNIVVTFSPTESPAPNGTPALFFPECYSDEGCVSDDICAVAFCNYGICEQINIDPVFEALTIGECEVGLDTYSLELSLSMAASPGGLLTIQGEVFEINPGLLNYTFTLFDLPANASEIDIDYTFQATGCTGTSGVLGTAPNPCPPVEVTFIVHTENIEVAPEGIHIGGTFQNWSPDENPMTEIAPGIWETTLTVGAGSHEFNYFNGSSIFDGEYVVGSCAQSGKRLIEVGEVSMTAEYCWAICATDCSVEPDGVNEYLANNLKMYPNPLNAGTPLQLEIASGDYNSTAVVMDMRGRMLQTVQLNGQNTSIATDQLVSGMYLIQLVDQNNQVIGVSRFVVN